MMAEPPDRNRSPGEWETLADEDLLRWRIRDLGLQIQGSPLEPRIERLYAELDARGIRCHPPCYLTDEWLCPDGVPLIGIPFYLAHPRLKSLERHMMLEVEGGTEPWCMKLLRHEAGHALNYAYRLHRRTRWRELFGPFSRRYTDSYYPRPYSRKYVQHLDDNYAQSHPDEDFAETFAVWLTPGSRWEARYRDWPAIRKLRYVDSLMSRLGAAPPAVSPPDGPGPWAASRMTSTLEAYYQRMRRRLGSEFPGHYDAHLQRLFGAGADRQGREGAGRFLRRYRRPLRDSVCQWTGLRKYDIDKLVRTLTARVEALDLYVRKSELETALEVTAFVTSVAGNLYRLLVSEESP